MPSQFLFLPSTPLSLRPKSRLTSKCPRRARIPVAATAPPPSDNDDAPSWNDLARSLGAPDDNPERPAPQWKLPDDEPGATSPEASTAWSSWNAANLRPPPREAPRDPRKETDFWRSAARDLTASPDAPASGDSAPADSAPADSAPSPAQDISAQSDIWQMARGVTGEMTDMQNRLRADLDRYNPDENTEQYRDIARELVGPKSDEPWSEADPARPGATRDAEEAPDEPEAGSGWNPDVDWKRFDDVRREQVLKQDKASREEVARKADEERRAALDRIAEGAGLAPTENISYVDEDGNELSPDEVQRAMQEGAMFVDEAGAEIDTIGTGSDPYSAPDGALNADSGGQESVTLPDGSMPGFLSNRFKSRGTYGASWSGAEDEIRAMQEKGIPLRDPKADADTWRSAAREIDIEVEPAIEDDTVASEKEGPLVDIQDEEKVEDVDVIADVVEQQAEDNKEWSSEGSEHAGSEEEEGTSDTGESSLWSQWQQSRDNWEKAAENSAPRDPKKEVDMWRSSARDLTSDVKDAEDIETTAKESTGTRSAWDAWRTANANWQASITSETGTSSQQRNPWASADIKSDWGAGLNGKASSERSAWENWDNVKGNKFGGDSSLWWSGKSTNSTSRNARSVRNERGGNSNQWASAARELTNQASDVPQNAIQSTTPDLSQDQTQRQKEDVTVDFWKDIAKDLPKAEVTDSIGEEESDK